MIQANVLKAFFLACALSLCASASFAVPAAKPAKTKPAAKGKAKAKAGAKKNAAKPVAGKKGAKAGKAAVVKDAKGKALGKAVKKDVKAAAKKDAVKGAGSGSGSGSTASAGSGSGSGSTATASGSGSASGEATTKAGKSPGKMAAKTGGEELDEQFGEEDLEEESSAGTIVVVLLLMAAVGAGGFVFWKKKQAAGGGGGEGADLNFESSHESAFADSESSLSMDDKKKKPSVDKPKSSITAKVTKKDEPKDELKDDAAAAPEAKPEKKGFGLGALKDKAKAAAKAGMSGAAGNLAKNVAGNVGGNLVGDLAGAVGGDMVGDLAAGVAGRAIGNAAGNATAKAVDKKLNKPAPGAPEAAMPAAPMAPDAPGEVGMAGAPMGGMPAMPMAPAAEVSEPVVSAPADDYDRPVTGADWIGWDKIEPEEFFYRIKCLEYAGIKGGDDAYEAKMREMGFRDHIHYQRVKDAYAVGKDENMMMQAALNATGRHSKEQMKAAAPSYPDVHGLDVKTYGVVASRRARCKDDAARTALLAEYGLDDAKYAEVDTTWQARMKEAMTADPAAGGDLMIKYGQGFAEGSSGQFAKAAQAGGVASDVNTAAGTAPDAPEPVSFAKFVEIEQAQRAWSQQGQDIGAKLQEVFGISILDWSDIGAYWSPKVTSDLNYVRQYNELQPRFAAQYGVVSAA